jgi:hypothetical protein
MAEMAVFILILEVAAEVKMEGSVQIQTDVNPNITTVAGEMMRKTVAQVLHLLPVPATIVIREDRQPGITAITATPTIRGVPGENHQILTQTVRTHNRQEVQADREVLVHLTHVHLQGVEETKFDTNSHYLSFER